MRWRLYVDNGNQVNGTVTINVYQILKEKTLIDNLQNEIDSINRLKDLNVSPQFEQGTISTRTGNNSNSSYYIRTTGQINANDYNNLSISYEPTSDELDNNIIAYVFLYNDDSSYSNNYISKTITKNTKENFKLEQYNYFRIAIRFLTSSTEIIILF